MSDEMVVYEGRQYRADSLPEGVKKSDTVPLDEWYEENRVPSRNPAHKAVEAPVQGQPVPKASRKSKGK